MKRNPTLFRTVVGYQLHECPKRDDSGGSGQAPAPLRGLTDEEARERLRRAGCVDLRMREARAADRNVGRSCLRLVDRLHKS